MLFCFKELCSGCKNLIRQARSGKPKSMDSEAVAQGEYQPSLASHNPVWFVTFTASAKASEAADLCLRWSEYYKTFEVRSVSFVIGISTFMGYLMLKPCL